MRHATPTNIQVIQTQPGQLPLLLYFSFENQLDAACFACALSNHSQKQLMFPRPATAPATIAYPINIKNVNEEKEALARFFDQYFEKSDVIPVIKQLQTAFNPPAGLTAHTIFSDIPARRDDVTVFPCAEALTGRNGMQ